MRFTDIFIRRPVFATALSLMILVTGLMSFSHLAVRQFPFIESSVITVTTTYAGASADLMAGFVSTPLETALGSVEGVDYMTSVNTQGQSQIQLFFDLGYDINAALNEVGDVVSSVRNQLPDNINPPVISKNDPNARPTLYIAFTSNKMSAEQVTDYLLRVIQPQVQTLPGVGLVQVYGQRLYSMRIWLKPSLMTAYNVSMDDVTQALAKNNVQSTAGDVEGGLQEYMVNAATDISNAEQFNNLVIKQQNGQLIRIRDIGYATLGPQNDDVAAMVNGIPGRVLAITPLTDANPLSVGKVVTAKLAQLKASLPEDLKYNIVWDSSKFISASIEEVVKTIIEAIVLVIIVIFLFLGSMRATLIPVVTIPLSLIGTCTLMLAMNFTLNTLTLLAWVLAIGMVVDDAIVVSENIYRHIELGKSPIAAGIIGAREIGFAVIAMTLTLAAVFAPIGFTGGLTGSLFREFAFTLAGSVIVSGIIALTLSPMMCSKILRHETSDKSFMHRVDQFFIKLHDKYHQVLKRVINSKKIIIGIGVIIYLLSALLYHFIPEELAPSEDQGGFFVMIEGPAAATLNYTEKYTAEIEKIYKSIPQIQNFVIVNGAGGENEAISFAALTPWGDRTVTAMQIIKAVAPKFFSIPGLMVFPFNLPSLPATGNGQAVNFVLKSVDGYYVLNAAMERLMAAAHNYPGLVNIDTDLKIDLPQVEVDIDRNKAGDLGISMTEISNALSTALSENNVNYFNMSQRSYEVIPQVVADASYNPEQLNDIYLRSSTGALVPLSNIATIKMITTPREVSHFQQLPSATLEASVAPGYTMGEDLNYLTNLAKQILPADVSYDYGGQSRQFVEEQGAIGSVMIFALVFIYLVLAAQFESFRDPLIILLTVPLAFFGALLAVFLIGGTLNIYTKIGLVTLIGLISKHGILIVEFANQQQEKGLTLTEAVIEAAGIRLRPILMTTAAMVLGSLPLAFASGAGAEARHQLGWVIVGGMSIGTLFTLFVLPVVYTLLAGKVKHFTTGDSELDKSLYS